jgi:hypothetical protein
MLRCLQKPVVLLESIIVLVYIVALSLDPLHRARQQNRLQTSEPDSQNLPQNMALSDWITDKYWSEPIAPPNGCSYFLISF